MLLNAHVKSEDLPVGWQGILEEQSHFELGVGKNIDSAMHCNPPSHSISIQSSSESIQAPRVEGQHKDNMENSASCCRKGAPTESIGAVGRSLLLQRQLAVRGVSVVNISEFKSKYI